MEAQALCSHRPIWNFPILCQDMVEEDSLPLDFPLICCQATESINKIVSVKAMDLMYTCPLKTLAFLYSRTNMTMDSPYMVFLRGRLLLACCGHKLSVLLTSGSPAKIITATTRLYHKYVKKKSCVNTVC